MREEKSKIINTFKEYTIWVETLKTIEESAWVTPISEGKWSISQIVSHIINWDNHLLLETVPSVIKGEGMEFPEFNTFNKIASEYAKSGISQIGLIEEAITTRESLVKALLQMSDDELNRHLTSNGISQCPHTGEPYCLIYVIKEFIEHDYHHKQQIVNFISRNSLV